jgi:uncharacterized membrane protein YecN with MAPEG domain
MRLALPLVLELPLVSALTAGVLLILQMVLMLRVVLARRAGRQSLGTGNDDRLLRAVRQHGNLAENAGIFVAGLGERRSVLAVLCAALVTGRVAHVVGLSMKNTVNPARALGVAATATVGITLGFRLVAIAIRHLCGSR